MTKEAFDKINEGLQEALEGAKPEGDAVAIAAVTALNCLDLEARHSPYMETKKLNEYYGAVVAVLSERDQLKARVAELEGALEDLLMHCGIADAAPEDKDAIDHSYERAARKALSRAKDAGIQS